MIIKQLSVFLQNKLGRFSEMATVLGEAGVNMQAFTVAENADFGIVRLIVEDVDKAVSVLREHSFAVSVNDVILAEMPDVPGALSVYMNRLTDVGLFIEYMYAFSQASNARVVIKVNDVERGEELIKG